MHRAQALVFLGNLRHNLQAIRQRAPGTRVLAAVKADAYGHGATRVASVLEAEGVDFFGVATVEEAALLRRAGIRGAILLLGVPHPAEIAPSLELGLSFVVSEPDQLDRLADAARGTRYRLPLHLKIDVGMGRLGTVPERAVDLARRIRGHPRLHWEGVMTHFPCSDNGREEPTRSQNRMFLATLRELSAAGFDFEIVHAANSGAVLDHPETHHDMVRPGILLYGYTPAPNHPDRERFHPVMQLESRLVLLKELSEGSPLSYGQTYRLSRAGTVGVVGIGYADGYPRGLSNRGRVRIGEAVYTVSGRVCMDLLMVDLGPASSHRIWDRVVLFGPYREGPDAWEVAGVLDTIPYEVTCGVSWRVPRVYVDEERYL